MDKYNLDQLVKDVARGDESAYRRLLEASAKLVRGYLLAKVTGAMRADVEDIVQEILLAVHLKYNSYNPALPYLPWLRTIAHHKLVDAWRKRKMSGAVPFDDVMAETIADGTSQSADTDAALTLERLMAQLPEKQQKVVRLARIDGKSMAEIAREMMITVADVKVTLHRAIRKLGESVKEEDTIHAHG
jgi:RNA polymerase sigma-70 factor (ECF subfamily)